MLDAHRPTATIALATLTRAGFIQRTRNHIVIVDREGLLEASCECYSAAR
jgi:hypothetical protein